jgi:hypothetical protein
MAHICQKFTFSAAAVPGVAVPSARFFLFIAVRHFRTAPNQPWLKGDAALQRCTALFSFVVPKNG